VALPSAALERAGIHISSEDFTALMLEAIENLPVVIPTGDPRSELTAAEIAALERGGFNIHPLDLGKDDPLARTAAEYAALVTTGLSVGQTAEILHVDGSRIRQRLLERTLYGIKLRGNWHVPTFQFDGNRLILGIEAVISVLDPDLHPVAIFRWFTYPNVDLEVDGVDVSPRDWLRMGGDVTRVAAIAAAL